MMLISTELCLVVKLHIQGCKLVGLSFAPFSFPVPLWLYACSLQCYLSHRSFNIAFW